MKTHFSVWVYNTSINYLYRQGLAIRCTGVKLSKESDKYELTFTYQANSIVETFSRIELDHCPRPEPIIKYLCNKANHRLVFGEIE